MYKNIPAEFEAPSLCDDHTAVHYRQWQPPAATDKQHTHTYCTNTSNTHRSTVTEHNTHAVAVNLMTPILNCRVPRWQSLTASVQSFNNNINISQTYCLVDMNFGEYSMFTADSATHGHKVQTACKLLEAKYKETFH